jgi:hypothetical protein
MRMRWLITLCALSVLLYGCGNFPPSPGEVTQNYVNAIAEGEYGSACAMLDGAAQDRLKRAMHSNDSCAALLARCLPSNAAQLSKDQAQLFYANTLSSVDGDSATVKTNGTAVADRIRAVTLVKQKGNWVLTSYGAENCAAHRARAHRR